jgi:hypothetical protein
VKNSWKIPCNYESCEFGFAILRRNERSKWSVACNSCRVIGPIDCDSIKEALNWWYSRNIFLFIVWNEVEL